METPGRPDSQKPTQSQSPGPEADTKRLSLGQSPIGSERGPSPGFSTTNPNASVASLTPSAGRNSGEFESMNSSGILDPSDTEGIKARLERKRLEHERQREIQRQKFEEQMRSLEKQQREEEATLLRQEDDKEGSQERTSTVSPYIARTKAGELNSTNSASRTSPFTGSKSPSTNLINSLRASTASSPSSNALGSGLTGGNDTEDGWNGSNVPGLPPLSAVRSNPDTRRSSRDNGPRDANNAPHDLANSFNRLSVGGGATVPNTISAAPGVRTGPAVAAPGVSRLLSRTGFDAGNANGSDANGSAGMTPVFNERFLFDDELDAEDSAFVKKYNLSDDDDKFPVLLRNDKFVAMPNQLSSSSAALDLAPLSQTEARYHARGSTGDDGPVAGHEGPRLSEWPQFEGRGREDQFLDRRGRSERNSPRLSGTNNVTSVVRTHGNAQPAPRVSSGAPADRQVVLGAGSVAASSPHPPNRGPAYGGVAARGPLGGRNQLIDETGSARFRSGAIPSQNDAAGASRLSSGPHIGPRDDARDFSAFGLDGSSNKRFGSMPPVGAFDDDASQNRNGAFYPGFGNGTGINAAFGYGASDENLSADELAARKGELDINTRLEDLQGEIFTLCKDQHGCRYLQKKLEEGVPTYRDMIFTETFSHFADLMTDPFGNYLCQKLLEFCTDEQRDLIVESVSSELVTISLNMHGTRAVQKTIDFLSTSRQIHSIILALSMNVVTLIKDLNGNHVIQKCLNRLGAEDNQFIYNAVAAHCIEVATHRHGCCVLQRCVDHASDKQRVQLVQEITYNALTLVQDPFGNYVVQYILDLNDARFTEAVIRQFIGNVCLLSVQKFSSNVIEKCIRVSPDSVRRLLVEELLNRARLEKLLRDSFANYVVQTALDYSDPIQRAQLVECIRPILPMIRNTPYGKRIQSKLQRESFDLAGPGGGGVGMMGGAGGSIPPPGSAAGNAHYQQLLAAAAQQQQQHYQTMAALAAAQGQGHGGGGPMRHQGPPHQSMNYPPHPAGGGFGRGAASPAISALPPPHQLYSGLDGGATPPTGPSRGGYNSSPGSRYGGGGGGGGGPAHRGGMGHRNMMGGGGGARGGAGSGVNYGGGGGYPTNGTAAGGMGAHARGHYHPPSVGYGQGPF